MFVSWGLGRLLAQSTFLERTTQREAEASKQKLDKMAIHLFLHQGSIMTTGAAALSGLPPLVVCL